MHRGTPSPLQVFDLGNHYLQSSGGSGAQKMLPGGGASAALALGTTAGPLTSSEIKAVKGMPAEAVISRWKDTVRELGNILVQVGGVLRCAGGGGVLCAVAPLLASDCAVRFEWGHAFMCV